MRTLSTVKKKEGQIFDSNGQWAHGGFKRKIMGYTNKKKRTMQRPSVVLLLFVFLARGLVSNAIAEIQKPEPIDTCSFWGDSHFTGFKGQTYSIFPEGGDVLTFAEGSYVIATRHHHWDPSGTAPTVPISIAVRLSMSEVVEYDAPLKQFRVNGNIFPIAVGQTRYFSSGSIKRTATLAFEIDHKMYHGKVTVVDSGGSMPWLTVVIQVPRSISNRAVPSLCGNYNGDYGKIIKTSIFTTPYDVDRVHYNVAVTADKHAKQNAYRPCSRLNGHTFDTCVHDYTHTPAQQRGELFSYGRHFPNGNSAVQYLYHPQNGTFKYMTKPEYIWNYYEQYGTPKHPFNRTALIQYASNGHTTTCRDANGHLLLDFNHTGDIDPRAKGSAFHEHNGRGEYGSVRGNAFLNFWFDDNWLARYMSQAYHMQEPYGLSKYNDFTRWQIIGGDDQNWHPYLSDYIDTYALDGLYSLLHDVQRAKQNWTAILKKSKYIYDSNTQQYIYPGITENYYFGLFMILTANLYTKSPSRELLQHMVSIRSSILSNQQKKDNELLGWTSGVPAGGSLINTESVSACVLGLGATSIAVYEAGSALSYCKDCSYFVRPYHAISAVVKLSTAGFLTYGPFVTYKDIDPDFNSKCSEGCTVQYFVRMGSNITPVQEVATVDIAVNGQSLQKKSVLSNELEASEWVIVELPLPLDQPNDAKFEFRFYWQASANIDVSFIRIVSNNPHKKI